LITVKILISSLERHQLADLKRQISQNNDITCATHRQNVIVLRNNIIFYDICCFRSASLLIIVFKRRCKLLSLKKIIFVVFLHDLASAYKISSKGTTQGKVMTLYRFFKMAAIETEVYSTLWFCWQHSFSNVQIYLNIKFR